MQITRLSYQKKDPNRVNVYVDGKFAAGLDINAVVKLGLFKGQQVSLEKLNEVIGESDFGKKLNAALNFLSFRPRSEFEIRQFFRRKKFEDIEPVIEKLKILGQIDDAAFAKWFLDQRSTFRPKGRRALQSELSRLGVKTKIASDIDEKALAEKAMTRYHGEKTPEKIQRYLQNRGFNWDTINDIIEKLC